MDRLICGDVGFGKTEVAIRAAFKSVMAGKQVALLVPTTVLAMQHFATFKKRFSGYPVNIDMMSRFRTKGEIIKMKDKLSNAEIDIIIGTHALLARDVNIKNLGLLIIDEEQRFGVKHKEQLKKFRALVDVLTLSATPIPRTLHISMAGIRDLTIIATPPENRQSIETYVIEDNPDILREAILAEIKRGGQVFFVTTRVMNIMDISVMVQRAVPGVKVAVAHGQMEGHKLEKVMIDFIEGEYDVLIATTIIESGLDISNVNTIIINDAHHYGLSDLHQLRGRVGRSNKKAFCYLLAPPMSSLTDEARKRLRAIEEFADLGSGFNIAMRDLDIRGAGNILGAEQSGFISEIGFEMYQKILDEALQELKEKEFSDIFPEEVQKSYVRECVIETDLELLIPDSYVTSITERLNLYKELDSTETEEGLMKFTDKLIDRFGPVPPQTQSLIQTIRLRRMGRAGGFEKLALRNNRLNAYFISNPESPYFQSAQFNALLEYIKTNPGNCRMKQDNNKLILAFAGVGTIAQAIGALASLPGLEAI